MASNLFQLNHNFLTRKWPSLSTKSHFLKHTEIYVSSEMIAYAPQDIFQTLSVPVRLGICKKRDFEPVLACFFCLNWSGTSSCNSSATLPLATSACRGYMCGRFNNFVELSTYTPVLRHSERRRCGRRIAGTIRMHSDFYSRQ